MKNIIRRAVYAVVALASMFSVSCSSDLDEITKPSNGGNNTSTSGITKLNASISQEESMATKAVLGAKGFNGVYPITWEVGDQIAVSNTQTSPSVFSAEFAGGNTEFVLSSGDAPINAKTTGAISAFYPVGMVTGFIDGKYVVNLPEVQRYTEGSFDKEAYLMGAYTTVSENSNPNLEFKSLCSVLDLQVTSSYDTRVKRIVISSTSPLSGKGEVTLGVSTKKLTMDQTEANTSVVLDCGDSGVELKKEVVKNFYVVVPSQDYGNLRINVETTDGEFQIFNNTEEISLGKAKLAPVRLAYNNVKKIPLLPSGLSLHNDMIRAATSANNIIRVVFEVNSSKTSTTIVNGNSTTRAPIYLNFNDGTITFSTPASWMKVNNDSFLDLFFNFINLVEIVGLGNIDTSYATIMQETFSNCSSLTSIDLGRFNTSNVTTMSSMFDGCTSLTSLDLSSFDTSNVTTMSGMFTNCRNLIALDLSSFNTSSVENMSLMFKLCTSITSLDLSNFITKNVKNMGSMFSMFSLPTPGCKLMSLDLSQFEISDNCDIDGMMSFVNNDITIYCTESTKNKLLDIAPKTAVFEGPTKP